MQRRYLPWVAAAVVVVVVVVVVVAAAVVVVVVVAAAVVVEVAEVAEVADACRRHPGLLFVPTASTDPTTVRRTPSDHLNQPVRQHVPGGEKLKSLRSEAREWMSYVPPYAILHCCGPTQKLKGAPLAARPLQRRVGRLPQGSSA